MTRTTVAHRSAPPRQLQREAVGPAVVNGRRCWIEPDEDGYPAAHYTGHVPPQEWDIGYRDRRGMHHWILFLTITLTLVPLACLIASIIG